jgi:hypothetical protein
MVQIWLFHFKVGLRQDVDAKQAEWQNGNGMAEWWNGEMVEWWTEWWNGGMAEWWNGGMVIEWRNGGNGGTAERMAEWQNGRSGYIHTIYGTRRHNGRTADGIVEWSIGGNGRMAEIAGMAERRNGRKATYPIYLIYLWYTPPPTTTTTPFNHL